MRAAGVVVQCEDNEMQYRLESVNDGNSTGHGVNVRSWFHFRVFGFPAVKGTFIVSKVHALQAFCQPNAPPYNAVFSRNHGPWLPLSAPVSLSPNGDVECLLQYNFQAQDQVVAFAFCTPYTYAQHLQYLQQLQHKRDESRIYYHKEILIYSPQGRPVHLLTITSQEGKLQTQDRFDPLLFTQNKRARRFNKAVIVVTARVHPGQTHASYALEGVMDFLTNKEDLRAQLLRRMFVWMVVPMINVDGVYHGHFRMDYYGRNLNRYYLHPDAKEQPAVYAIKQLTQHLAQESRLCCYFDLHAHHGRRQCFMYGNAMDDFVEQVETQMFCKLFALNHSSFNYGQCDFSERQMHSKDHSDQLGKQGCGRVVMYRMTGIIHSYSLECSPMPLSWQEHLPIANPQFSVQGLCSVKDQCLVQQDIFRAVGKALLITVLDMFDTNPYNRVYVSPHSTIQTLRRATAFEVFHSADRFRMHQKFIFGKVKNINSLIHSGLHSYYQSIQQATFYNDPFFNVEWPPQVTGLNNKRRINRRQPQNKRMHPPSLPHIPYDAVLHQKSVRTPSRQQHSSHRKDQYHKQINKKCESNFPFEECSSVNKQIASLKSQEYTQSQKYSQSQEYTHFIKKNNEKLKKETNLEKEENLLTFKSTNLEERTHFWNSQVGEQEYSSKKNVYQTIKQEIMAGLQRETERRKKNVQLFKKQILRRGTNSRATTLNKNLSKVKKPGLQLPSLGMGLYILANTSKM